MTASVGTGRRQVVVFLAVAFALPWLAWLGLQWSGVNLVAPLGMLSVGIAVLVALRLTGTLREGLVDTGVLPLRPLGPLLGKCVLGFGVVVGLAVLAMAVGAIAGTSRLDPAGLSALRLAHGGSVGSAPALLASSLGQSLVLFLVLIPLAFCEEWGWRGLLFPRLRQWFGLVPAVGLSGLVWGLWHLPGYVGRGAGGGFLPFLIFAIVFGALLCWLRLRTESIWPAVFAHAANNTVVIGFVNVAVTDVEAVEPVDPWSFGLSGWPGWLVMGLLLAALVLVQRRRRYARRHVPVADRVQQER